MRCQVGRRLRGTLAGQVSGRRHQHRRARRQHPTNERGVGLGADADSEIDTRKALPVAKTGGELVYAMKLAYPQVTDGVMSLDIGAKVNKGEKKW